MKRSRRYNQLTVSKLSRRTHMSKLEHEINNLLRTIDDNIDTVANGGRMYYEFPLPLSFEGVPLERSNEARMYVYSTLIEDLEERGFKVEFEQGTQKHGSYLHIHWKTNYEEEDKKKMINILESHKIKGRINRN